VFTKSVVIKNGKAFPEPFRFYLLIGIICVATIAAREYQGFGFLLVPLSGITSRRGTRFTTQGYRRYFSVFGLKFGIWETVNEGEQMVLIGLNMSSQYGSYGGMLATKEEKLWTLYIVNAKHRNKRDIGVAADKDYLIQKAAEVADITALELVPFSPAISQQTRNRKRR
tara:strand:- start:14530 stop:15036 length:507 start_codon:yes stop_codon:yes gene_type:complete